MGKSAGYKVKISRPLPEKPVIAICLPGDGYVGKFCGESLVASTAAELGALFSPYNFPPRVAIEQGELVLNGYQFFVGGTPAPNIVILTSDLKITDADIAVRSCAQVATFIKQLAPREILVLDGCVPTREYRGNYLAQIIVGTPPSEFWETKLLSPFQFKSDKDKYFLMMAGALQREDLPARVLVCETSGKDIDPQGAKKLLEVLKGHPAFPAQFDIQKIDVLAKEIHDDLEKLTEKDRERAADEKKRRKEENRDLQYIQ